MTCPFTGAEFTALEYADGKIVFHHAITGEEIHMNWNSSCCRYNLTRDVFKHIKTVTMGEAADILGVSRQRVSKIAKDGIIKAHDVNGTMVFVLSDVLTYKNNRKVGAPCKEESNGTGHN